jgi:quinol-cytochrome oxidoreductase complex cytochrome b subunit
MSSPTWTERLRDRLENTVPQGQALPDRQPAYVASWIYVFGVLTLAALVVIVVTGIVLAFGGVVWWHTSTVGHFVNSLHLWSVELFFFFMVIHLWGKFWMAAWRGGRALTQAKDGLNSVGAGAYFNVLNTAQMVLFHVVLLPLGVGAITVVHVILVRRKGVVPPIEAKEPSS